MTETLEQWKQRIRQRYSSVQFTREDGSGKTYGSVGDWTAHTGFDMQADVVSTYVEGESHDTDSA